MPWPGNPDTRRQYFQPQGVLLAALTGANPEGPITIPRFLVMTPDSRLRVKIAIILSLAQGTALPFDSSALGAFLYLAEMEQDWTGASAQLLPCVAIEGTQTAPTALPKDPDLLLYSKEFVTAGDAIAGYMTIQPEEGPIGSLVLQARWQPDGQRLPDDEWDEIRRLCSIVSDKVVV